MNSRLEKNWNVGLPTWRPARFLLFLEALQRWSNTLALTCTGRLGGTLPCDPSQLRLSSSKRLHLQDLLNFFFKNAERHAELGHEAILNFLDYPSTLNTTDAKRF